MVTAIEMRALRLNLQLSEKKSKEIIQKKKNASKILTRINTKDVYELEYILDKISEDVFYGKLELDSFPPKKIIKALRRLGFKVDISKEKNEYPCIYW